MQDRTASSANFDISEEDGGNEKMNGCIRKFDITRFFQYIKMYIERWMTKKDLREELETVIETLLLEIPKMNEEPLEDAYINPQISMDLCRLLTQIPSNANSQLIINNQGYPCTTVTFPTKSGMCGISFAWIFGKSPEEQPVVLTITVYTHNSFLATDSKYNGAEIGFSETFGFNPISHFHSFTFINQNEPLDQQEDIGSWNYPYYDNIELEPNDEGGK